MQDEINLVNEEGKIVYSTTRENIGLDMSKPENKEAYDYLYGQRAKIEDYFGRVR